MESKIDVTIRLLGPLRLEKGDEVVDQFRSRRVVALLAYLVSRRQAVSRPQLVTLLWPDKEEKRGRANLRWALSQLRTLLPDCWDATRQTVRFVPPPGVTVDLDRLRVALQAGEMASLETAVPAAQGEFLAGFYFDQSPEFETWLLARREYWRQQRRRALEQLADHYQQQGSYRRALGYARRLIDLAPWQEAAHRRVMRLLARAGDVRAALAQYEQCRRVLEEELGARPTAQTEDLFRRLQRAVAGPRHNLPPQPTPFLGRAASLARLADLLGDPAHRLITISGPGGVGKTRLAIEAAKAHVAAFLDGVAFVSLANVETPDLFAAVLVETLAQAEFIDPPPERQSPREALLNHLAERELLLVLDNVEQLLVPVRDLLPDLLERAPHLKVLVTSRERLNLRWERLLLLRGLSSPERDDDPAWESYDAIRLFQSVVAQQNPQAPPPQKARVAVTAVCRLVQGFPLGIELAAVQARHRSYAAIAADLRHNLDALTTPLHDVPGRQQSMRAIFDAAWERLEAEEQVVFRRLAVFRGGFTPGGAAAVAEATPMQLASFVDRSLLRFETATPRYAMHLLLRQYAWERLACQPAALAETQRAHAAYYAALLADLADAFTGDRLSQTLAVIQADIDNVRAAWQYAVEAGEDTVVARAMRPLHKFYEGMSWYQEAVDIFGAAVAAWTEANPEAAWWGSLRVHYAACLVRVGRLQEAGQEVKEALSRLRAAGEAGDVAFALNLLGITHLSQGEFEAARAAYEESLALYRASGQRRELVKPLANLGGVYLALGVYKEGKTVLQEGLAICEEIDDRRGMSHFHNNLGAVCFNLGELRQARRHYEASLALSRETNHTYAEMVTLYNLGEIANREEGFVRAERLATQSVALARQLGDRRNLGRALKVQGVALTAQGAYLRAWLAFREGLRLTREIAADPITLDLLEGMVGLLLAEGEEETAVSLLHLIAAHPATEGQYRTQARRRLREMGIEPLEEILSQSLQEQVNVLLHTSFSGLET